MNSFSAIFIVKLIDKSRDLASFSKTCTENSITQSDFC